MEYSLALNQPPPPRSRIVVTTEPIIWHERDDSEPVGGALHEATVVEPGVGVITNEADISFSLNC